MTNSLERNINTAQSDSEETSLISKALHRLGMHQIFISTAQIDLENRLSFPDDFQSNLHINYSWTEDVESTFLLNIRGKKKKKGAFHPNSSANILNS